MNCNNTELYAASFKRSRIAVVVLFLDHSLSHHDQVSRYLMKPLALK